VPGKFVDHPLAIDFVLGGMVQDVQPDESRKEVVMLHGPASFWLSTIGKRYRNAIVV
jgi:hypothetical protein